MRNLLFASLAMLAATFLIAPTASADPCAATVNDDAPGIGTNSPNDWGSLVYVNLVYVLVDCSDLPAVHFVVYTSETYTCDPRTPECAF